MKTIIAAIIISAHTVIMSQAVPFEHLGYTWEQVEPMIANHEWVPMAHERQGDELVVVYKTDKGQYAEVRFYA